MLNSIIEFASSVLPSVSKENVLEAKDAILQFEKAGKKYDMLSAPLKEMSQGDIIDSLPFISINGTTGNIGTLKAPGMILSTSCHIDQKSSILIAPLIEITNDLELNMDQLRNNTIFDYMYLKTIDGKEFFVDFGKVSTFPKELLENENSKVTVKKSLTQLGYYLFLIKLTVYFMRKEDNDTMTARLKGA